MIFSWNFLPVYCFEFLIRRSLRRILVPTFSFFLSSSSSSQPRFFKIVFCIALTHFMALIFGMEVTDRHGSMLLGVGYAWALPSMPGHDPHVPIWANFVVYEPILKISNSIGFLAFFYPNGPLGMPGHYPVCPGMTHMCPFGLTLLFMS